MPKFGDKLIVTKQAVCLHFLYEMNKYPRDGFREADKEKYTLKENEEVYFIHEGVNFVEDRVFWIVQKVEGTEWEFCIKPDYLKMKMYTEKEYAAFEDLLNHVTRQGYKELKYIPGQGVCGLFNFIYTIGLCTHLTAIGYWGRYCFKSYDDAKQALADWNGDSDPPGEWIKYKGWDGERSHEESAF